jgi:hypothetical protein
MNENAQATSLQRRIKEKTADLTILTEKVELASFNIEAKERKLDRREEDIRIRERLFQDQLAREKEPDSREEGIKIRELHLRDLLARYQLQTAVLAHYPESPLTSKIRADQKEGLRGAQVKWLTLKAAYPPIWMFRGAFQIEDGRHGGSAEATESAIRSTRLYWPEPPADSLYILKDLLIQYVKDTAQWSDRLTLPRDDLLGANRVYAIPKKCSTEQPLMIRARKARSAQQQLTRIAGPPISRTSLEEAWQSNNIWSLADPSSPHNSTQTLAGLALDTFHAIKEKGCLRISCGLAQPPEGEGALPHSKGTSPRTDHRALIRDIVELGYQGQVVLVSGSPCQELSSYGPRQVALAAGQEIPPLAYSFPSNVGRISHRELEKDPAP